MFMVESAHTALRGRHHSSLKRGPTWILRGRAETNETAMSANWIDASAVPSLLKPGMRVYVGGSSNEPTGLLGRDCGAADERGGRHVRAVPARGAEQSRFVGAASGRAPRMLFHGAATR